ncbi:MAG: sterol desaturase family protein [Bacteroidota bacterium]
MKIVLLVIPVITVSIFLELIIDLVTKKKKISFEEFQTNLASGILYQLGLIIVLPITFFMYFYVYENLSFFTIENTLTNFFIGFILVDLCYYIAHRSVHRVSILWVDHSVHHSSTEYNLSTGIRNGSYQILYEHLFYLPLAFAGFDIVLFGEIFAAAQLYQFIVHTKKIKTMGFLDYVLVTPSHHRVHHATNSQYIDKNYGGVLIIWDKLFGTFVPEEEEVNYGITNMSARRDIVSVHTSELVNIQYGLQKQTSLWQKILVLIKPPQNYLKGISPLDETRQIMPQVSKSVINYCFVQFLIIAALGAVSLFLLEHGNFFVQVITLFALVSNFYFISRVFAKGSFKPINELIRLIFVSLIVVFFLMLHLSDPLMILIFSSPMFLLSTMSFLWYKRIFKRNEEAKN